MKKIKYASLEVGKEIPELVKQPSTQQLVMWAGASGDFNPIHYDKDFSTSKGLPGVIVPGQLVLAFLVEMVTDWLGDSGELKKISVSYKGMNFPGSTITCRGVIKAKLDSERQLTLDIWAENPAGEKTVAGTAAVTFAA